MGFITGDIGGTFRSISGPRGREIEGEFITGIRTQDDENVISYLI